MTQVNSTTDITSEMKATQTPAKETTLKKESVNHLQLYSLSEIQNGSVCILDGHNLTTIGSISWEELYSDSMLSLKRQSDGQPLIKFPRGTGKTRVCQPPKNEKAEEMLAPAIASFRALNRIKAQAYSLTDSLSGLGISPTASSTGLKAPSMKSY